jgi:hypothetical protein
MARVVPAEERRQRALSRIHAVRSRPTAIAAQEFFAGVDAKNWRSLPQRLERLCQVLEGWVSFVQENRSRVLGDGSNILLQVKLMFLPRWLLVER